MLMVQEEKSGVKAENRYGRLTVLGPCFRIRRSSKRKKRYTVWICITKCDCGNIQANWVSTLTEGIAKSCGCIQRESIIKINTSHGLAKHPIYSVWKGINRRCYSVTGEDYHHYGGRGISVCEEWRKDFKSFYDWAINRWKPGLEIDRINNDGNYEPDNCRFTTRKVQTNNTRVNHRLTAFGETKTLSEWCDDPLCVVAYAALKTRINRHKWMPEKALTKPLRKKHVIISPK